MSEKASFTADPQACGEEGEVPVWWRKHGSTSDSTTQAEEEGCEQDGLKG